MAAKKTSELIPLCHPIGLTSIEVDIERGDRGIAIRAYVKTVERTGVEMEALTAAAVAALTIYDMVKGIERHAQINDLRLETKSGGSSGQWKRD